MSIFGGGPKYKAPPAKLPAPPPPPPVEAIPQKITLDPDEGAEAERKRARKARGRASTILAGRLSAEIPGGKTLLGE